MKLFSGKKLRKIIKRAIITFRRLTCVSFKPRKQETDYLIIKSPSEKKCSSKIGNPGGSRTVRIIFIYFMNQTIILLTGKLRKRMWEAWHNSA